MPTFELSEVRTVSVQSAGATAILPGVISATLQPWYFQPYTVEIQGASNMGVFKNDSLNVLADNDVSLLWQLRENINQLWSGARSSINGLLVRLTIEDQTYDGNIDDIRTEESDDRPFIWNYTVRFTGISKSLNKVLTGGTAADQNKSVTSSAKSGGISPTSVVKILAATALIVPTVIMTAKGNRGH